jgi:hypothetical protein
MALFQKEKKKKRLVFGFNLKVFISKRIDTCLFRSKMMGGATACSTDLLCNPDNINIQLVAYVIGEKKKPHLKPKIEFATVANNRLMFSISPQ